MKVNSQQSDDSLLKGLQEGNLRRLDDGTLAKVNPDGTTSRLSDSELAQVIKDESVNNGNSALQRLTKRQLNKAIDNNPELQRQLIDAADNRITDDYNNSRKSEILQAIRNGVDNNMDGFLMRQSKFDDANAVRAAEGKSPYSNRQTILYGERTGAYNPENAIEGHYMKHADKLGGAEGVTDAMLRSINGAEAEAQAYPASKNSNTIFASTTADQGKNPASTVVDDDLGVRSISSRTASQMKKYARQKSDLLGSSQSGGELTTIATPNDASAGSPISSRQATKVNIAQNGENVNNGGLTHYIVYTFCL